MKYLLIPVLIALADHACAQAPSVQWQRSLGGIGTESAQCVNRTADSGYIVASTAESADGDVGMNKGGYDCWIVKLTSWGATQWKKAIGGSANEYANAVVQTTDGGYIVGGYTKSADGDVTTNHGDHDFWIVKMDDTGRIVWQKSLGGTGKEIFNAIQQTTDGGYVVVGNTASTDGNVTANHGDEDVWVVKLSATGSIQWQKTYGGTGEEDGTAIQQTSDGGYIVSANTSSNDGDVTGNHGAEDIWVLKLSSAGVIEWSACYGGTGKELDGDHAYPGNIMQTADGGYVLAGLTNSTDGDVTGYHGGAFFDYWVVKLSSTGSITWQKTFGGTNDDDGYYMQQTADGGYIVCGTTNSTDGDLSSAIGTFDYWIIKLTSSGNIQWQKKYGGTLDEYPYCIKATSDSEFIVCGYSKSNDVDVSGNHGDYDSWVVKLAYCSLPTTSFISGASSVCTGSVITLSNATTGGTWHAANGNVIVSGGVVTGVYAGNAPVFYTSTNSCGTGGAVHNVSVNPLPVPIVTQTSHTLSTTLPFVTYQWLKDGTPIAGATNPTYVTTAHDTFTVIVTNASGCSDTSAMYVSGLAVPATNNDNSILVFPNPTGNMIYVQGISKCSIHVYSIMGQLLQETNSNSVALALLPTGMYLIRVFDEQDMCLQQKKIWKQ